MERRKIVRFIAVVTVVLFFTRFLGLIREAVLAATYGAGDISDAFVMAFTIPNTVLACIGTSIGTVYTPIYHEVKDDKNRFTSNVINIVLILGIALTLLFSLCPGVLAKLFATGFNDYSYALTVKFIRVMMLSTIPILLFNVLKAYLQIKQAFFWANAVEAFINLAVIAGIGISRITGTLCIMAVATVIGNYLCLFALTISCYKNELKYEKYLNFRDDGIKKILYLMMPVFIGTVVAELNTVVDKSFASSLSTGTVSAMNYATKINGILYSLLSTSVSTVLYPELALAAKTNNVDKVRSYVNKCVRTMSFVILPITIFVIFEAEPIVMVLFQRGSFTHDNTVITAQCLQMYALGYLATNINPILQRVFYVYDDTKTPTINSIIAIVMNIILNFLTVRKLAHIGLCLSTSIAEIVTTALLLLQIRNIVKNLELRRSFVDIFKIGISSLSMILPLLLIERIICFGTSWRAILVKLMVVGIASFGIFILTNVVLHSGTIADLKEILRAKHGRQS
mgnify:FL=1